MILWLTCLAGLLLPLQAATVSTPASQQAGTPSTAQTTSRRETLDQAVDVEGLIRLDVTANDKAGNAIEGLTRDDFTVLDDGQLRPIIAFRASKRSTPQDAPISLILLVDTLDMQPHLADLERQQAEAFLRQHGGHLTQPVTIYSLDNTGCYRTAPPSTDGNMLADRIAAGLKSEPQFLIAPKHPPAQVPVIDDLYAKSPLLLGALTLGEIGGTQEKLPGRKQLVWIGPDGVGTGAYPDAMDTPTDSAFQSLVQKLNDDESSESLFGKVFWLSTLLRQSRMSIDILSTYDDAADEKYRESGPDAWKTFLLDNPTTRQANAMDLFKKVLAMRSGGRVLPLSKDLAQQLNDSARDAGSYYTLTFEPSLAAGVDEYHSLQVVVTRPDITTRTNTGYFDQPFYDDPPDHAIRKVTIAELEQIVHSIHGDGDGMRALSRLTLTERLSDERLKLLSAKLRGKKSRAQLEIIADESATLSAPPSEILADPPPDAATQQRILTAASQYLDHVIPMLPDFFATRTAVHYREIAAFHELDTTIQPQPMREGTRSASTVLYRNGREVVEASPSRHTPLATQQLETQGIFGPILGTMRAILKSPGGVVWSHWESSNTGRRAVFRAVFLGTPTVELSGCCSPEGNGSTKISSGFHGDIVIDPDSGAILRFQVLANLEHFVPTEHSDITVTYGPVEIGGKTYMLPIRSVNIWRARTVPDLKLWNLTVRTWGPYETQMNVFTHDHHHAFRGTSQILPGFTQQTEPK